MVVLSETLSRSTKNTTFGYTLPLNIVFSNGELQRLTRHGRRGRVIILPNIIEGIRMPVDILSQPVINNTILPTI